MGEPSVVTAEPLGEALACVERLADQLCDDSDGSGGFGEPLLDDDTAADSDDAHSQPLSQHKTERPDPADVAENPSKNRYALQSRVCTDFACLLL